MQIFEVKSSKDIRDFNQLPFSIYKNNKAWIPHLKQDVEKVFNPKQNKFFRHGEATRYILKEDNGKVIGRVAVFINKKLSKTFKQPTGGIGFFECINNKEAAFSLFDTCKSWLQKRDIQAMDGPINFGEKDKFWGLIVENFEAPPYYGQNFNPPYYVNFFEEYGFEVYYYQHVFKRDYHAKLQDKFLERADRIAQNPKLSIERIDTSKLEKYAEDFRIVYNRAWVTHDNFKGMTKVQAMSIMKTMKPVIDPNLIYFAYFEGKPVGFYISLPELNQAFRFVKGNLNLWGKLKFLFFKSRGVINTSFGVAFGIDPDFQGKGLEGAIFKEYEKNVRPYPEKYKDLIITWIGDFNPKMIRIIESLGGEEFRRLATYRYLFDRNKLFERAPIIGAKNKS